jgi:hypothetical protein
LTSSVDCKVGDIYIIVNSKDNPWNAENTRWLIGKPVRMTKLANSYGYYEFELVNGAFVGPITLGAEFFVRMYYQAVI